MISLFRRKLGNIKYGSLSKETAVGACTETALATISNMFSDVHDQKLHGRGLLSPEIN